MYAHMYVCMYARQSVATVIALRDHNGFVLVLHTHARRSAAEMQTNLSRFSQVSPYARALWEYHRKVCLDIYYV